MIRRRRKVCVAINRNGNFHVGATHDASLDIVVESPWKRIGNPPAWVKQPSMQTQGVPPRYQFLPGTVFYDHQNGWDDATKMISITDTTPQSIDPATGTDIPGTVEYSLYHLRPGPGSGKDRITGKQHHTTTDTDFAELLGCQVELEERKRGTATMNTDTNKLIFEIEGSQGDLYTVTFHRVSPGNINAICTCQAGASGIYCKHRFALLDGDTETLTSDNADDLHMLASWLPGTDIETTYNTVIDLQKQADVIKTKLAAAKKALAKAMYH
ncbi:hypothetical protein [uncultured Thalassospira sp.]|uniref:hypothetical protein n=1 Tax=uncultured Thalassospira sp. TaxID=404382 RepID=UPI0030DA8A86|tara:strand:+ start:29328 stop:30137 length:810 start_codon:yes stop_codon:yes gene_type:complete